MFCSICQHPQQPEMIIDYAVTCSLRETANNFGVGYRSLHRHLERCIVALMIEQEAKDYDKDFAEVAELVALFYMPSFKSRPKSIIKMPIEFTWSRRAWKPRQAQQKAENG